MANKNRSSEGSFFIAEDLADRLLPNLFMSELLLWPPDLFAYTSYVLNITGAYQLVISPPTDETWAPRNAHLKRWFSTKVAKSNVAEWFEKICVRWEIDAEEKKTYGDELAEKIDYGLDLPVSYFSKQENKTKEEPLQRLLKKDDRSYWTDIVVAAGKQWRDSIADITFDEFGLIDNNKKKDSKERRTKLFDIILKRTPPIVLASWAHFYKQTVLTENHKWDDSVDGGRAKMPIAALLCHESDNKFGYKQIDLWTTAQALISMHAICDEAAVGWGILNIGGDDTKSLKLPAKLNKNRRAQFFAEYLLRNRGTLSTVNPERCRVLPKRHNPSLGITLRSLSSNLAFHKSSVEVVWRNSAENVLTKKLELEITDAGDVELPKAADEKPIYISMLLLPLPIHVKTKDFQEMSDNKRVELVDGFGFFTYKPEQDVTPEKVRDLVIKATGELKDSSDSIDILVLPECAMTVSDVKTLEDKLKIVKPFAPSIYAIGVREEPPTASDSSLPRFSRNAVYCKYFDDRHKEKYGNEQTINVSTKPGQAPKYIQYKHHRWLLNDSQIKQYGLSQVLDPGTRWWEAIKVPRRRVSFLNVGHRMTMCHLICEDLARQDPIADLIRQVGPSLVLTILLDGPQRNDRWASRYASVLSEDPGCSVITLTSFGMVRRWSSPYRSMSRVVALWSDKTTVCREIELEQGAEAVLLTIEVGKDREITADGRKESEKHETTVFKLVDVIQVYP